MVTENGDGRDVVVKDSWINLLRKYIEGMILHILGKHGIEGVPMLVGEEQVKIQLWTPNPQQPVVNSSTHFLLLALPPNSPFHLQVLSHLISCPASHLILEFASIGELLVAFLDYTVGEQTFV